MYVLNEMRNLIKNNYNIVSKRLRDILVISSVIAQVNYVSLKLDYSGQC